MVQHTPISTRTPNVTNKTFSIRRGVDKVDTEKTVKFLQDSATATCDVPNPLEPTFMLADTSDTIDDFLSRPIKIASLEWEIGVALHTTLDPWSLYFEDKRVANRLANFYLLRAQLHVRVVVNSTQFYFGRLLVSYAPLKRFDTYMSFRPGVNEDFVEATQRPHLILNPTVNETGDITLPYIHPQSALKIPDAQWSDMGELQVASFNVLKNVNNATEGITVSIFAWAENVSYAQPTSTVWDSIPPQVENQSGDEYPEGLVSKPATAVSRFAQKLTSVPIIGPYARATEMIAGTTAAVAKMFGYSRPRTLVVENKARLSFGNNLAATNMEDTTDVLALDAKKEVTIDPRVTGASGTDEMALIPLAMRECFITTFPWALTDAAETLLFNIAVTPSQHRYELAGVTPCVHMIPACWVSQPFQFWRGSMTFRFEVVASHFHKGRLRVVYDPNYQASDVEYNVNYIEVVDVSDMHVFEVTVGWAQPLPYLPIDRLIPDNEYFSTDPFLTNIGNGILSVFVVNTLTAPSQETDGVEINVYARMEEDFEIQAPNGPVLSDLDPVQIEDPPGLIVPQVDVQYERITGATLSGVIPNEMTYPPSAYDTEFPEMRLTSVWLRMGEEGVWQTNGATITVAHTMDAAIPDFTGSLTFEIAVKSSVDADNALVTMTRDLVSRSAVMIVRVGEYTRSSITFDNVDYSGGSNVFLYDVLATPGITEIIFEAILAPNPAIIRRQVLLPYVTTTDATLRGIGPVANYGNVFYSNQDEVTEFYRLNPGESVTILPITPNATLWGLTARANNASYTLNGNPYLLKNLAYGEPYGDAVARNFFTAGVTPVVGGPWVLTNTDPTLDIDLFAALQHHPSSDLLEPENQSGEEAVETIETTNMAGEVSNEPSLASICFGEVPTSIRQILKRYVTAYTSRVLEPGTTRIGFPMLPVGTGTAQIGSIPLSLWDWYMLAFVAWRGSIRVKVIPQFGVGDDNCVSITRGITGEVPSGGRLNSIDTIASWSGSTIAPFNSVAEAEIPWYDNYRFSTVRSGSLLTQLPFNGNKGYFVDFAVTSNCAYNVCTSVGEDFSLSFFLNTPIVSLNS